MVTSNGGDFQTCIEDGTVIGRSPGGGKTNSKSRGRNLHDFFEGMDFKAEID